MSPLPVCAPLLSHPLHPLAFLSVGGLERPLILIVQSRLQKMGVENQRVVSRLVHQRALKDQQKPTLSFKKGLTRLRTGLFSVLTAQNLSASF